MLFKKLALPSGFSHLAVIFVLFLSFSATAAVPGVPSLSVPSSSSTGSYTVSWGSVSNVTRYELVGEMSGTLYSGTGRSSSRNKPNGTYYYKVRACNSSGCSAYSGKKGIVVSIVTKPPTPSLSVPSSDSDGSYVVSWGSSSGATRYELVGEMSGTIYSGTGRSSSRNKPNGTYNYKVRACNSAGCSAYSAIKGIVVSIVTIPLTPSLSVPSTDSDGSYVVSWGASSGATRYELVGEMSGTIYSGSGRLSSRNKPSGTYNYKVRACNSAGCSAYSAIKGIVVDIPPPAPAMPAQISATKFGGNDITISWSAVSGASHYYRQVSLDGGAWQNRNKYTNTSVTFYNQGPRTYKYRVQACNSYDICSSYTAASNTVTVLPVPAIPAQITASKLSHDDIEVSWSAVSGAAHYYRQVSINDGDWQNRNKYTEPSVTLYNQQYRSYKYRVQACNVDDLCSSYTAASNTVTLTAPAPMQVVQFEWIPAEVEVGENTAFHWEIANADKCYSSLSPQTAKAPSGQTSNYQYTEPGVYVTQWYCVDSAGNRFPADESQFLEATRTVTAKPPEPQSQIIFVHTDLLGSPVVETNEQGAEF